MPRFTITNGQRAAIYGQLRRHIASIDGVRVFADADPEEAGRLAFQYADDFRLPSATARTRAATSTPRAPPAISAPTASGFTN